MYLQLDPSLSPSYRSKSQIARSVTEAWAETNLYCLACISDRIAADKPNTKVRDFTCPSCSATYQLKSKNGKHGRVVANSAFKPKIAAIDEGRAPHYIFLEYRQADWTVTGLFVVPGHFISRAVVQPRPPLGPTARRAGWVGSNIRLVAIPPEGRISIVADGSPRDTAAVRSEWKRVEFLRTDPRAKGGWGADVLSCVRTMQRETGSREFTLQKFYARFVPELSLLHPSNQHVKAKIRQQLQVLRDGGLVEFLGLGRYQALS